jgi:3-methylcrotonyl-CoA carboxylase alpha subunit
MIAKLVTSAPTRAEALDNLRTMTERVRCWPVVTNAGFLSLALWDGDFEGGKLDTGLIERKGDELIPDVEASEAALQAVSHLVVDNALGGGSSDIRQTWLKSDRGPWSNRGFRLNRETAPTVVWLQEGSRSYEVVSEDRSIDDCPWVERLDDGWVVTENGVTRLIREWRPDGTAGATLANGALIAPMPGKVTSVDVTAGEQVAKGQRLLTLEAMKMEHAMVAPFDGVVAELNVEAGAQVQVEAVLARVAASSTPA